MQPDGLDENKQPTELVNASGFAFQLAVEAAVRAAAGRTGWSLAAREHPWGSPTGGGYIDLVVSTGSVHLVVECKRTRDATWVFLMPDPEQRSRSHARVCWTNTLPQQRPLCGWGDIQVYPASPEADFCVIRGQGERDKPLLERLGAGLAQAADGLASHLLQLREQVGSTDIVVPAIVTNATLMLASFSPKDVSLESGEVDNADFDIVPHLRFRKSLAAASMPDEYEPEQLRDLSAAAERTVFVINAVHFTSWLDTFEVDISSEPWRSARVLAGGP